jgi:3-hydroxyisobutyrate dehydrogenase-like beta-hydroxyacid dehydrogenase
MVASPEALKEVVFGEHGLVRALGPGQVYIDMSTVGPHTVRSIAARSPDGVAVVDAPVRGSVSQAAEGRLEIFVGASDEDFERVRPILESLGSVVHVGGMSAGAAMKLVANLALGASIAAVGEALALGEALGLGRAPCLTCSRARSWVRRCGPSGPISSRVTIRPTSSCATPPRTSVW